MEPLLDAVERAPPGSADGAGRADGRGRGRPPDDVPALTTLHRGALAQLRGDAEATAAFAAQMLARSIPENGC